MRLGSELTLQNSRNSMIAEGLLRIGVTNIFRLVNVANSCPAVGRVYKL